MPHFLEVFLKELLKSPIKQKSLSEAIYSATRPRSLMPLQFGLAAAVNNHFASKWLNNLLDKLVVRALGGSTLPVLVGI